MFSRLLKLASSVLFCAAVTLAARISLVSGYAGAYLTGPGLTLSHTLPFNLSYSGSQTDPTPAGLILYTYEEQSSGNLTHATLQMSNNEVAPFLKTQFFFTSADSFSGANLFVSSSVYLSERVTVNYAYTFEGSGFFAGAQEYLEFQNTHGTNLAGCNFEVLVPEPSPGSETCSTQKLLVPAGSEITLGNSLSAQILTGTYPSDGYSSSFNGTATLGPLNVYDLSGNLIESIDLNSLVSVPEPANSAFLGMGVLGLAFAVRKYYSGLG